MAADDEARASEAPSGDDEGRRLSLLRVALAVASAVTLLYTEPLWRFHDLPPQFPPFALAPPAWLDLPMFFAAIAALGMLIVGGRAVPAAAFTFLGAMLLLLLGDQHRWHSEIQMFVLFAAGVGVVSLIPAHRGIVLALLRLYVVSTYAYSGLQKLNPSFVHEVAPWLMQPALSWGGLTPQTLGDPAWIAIGISMALLEASLAILLTLPRTRTAGVILAVAMHAFVLLMIGPLGRHWNEVVWPWNAFMIVAVPVLFWRTPGHWLAPLQARPLAIAAAVAIALFPAGYALGLIDAYPAHNLYSGYPGVATTCVPRDAPIADEGWRGQIPSRTRTIDGRPWVCVDELGWYLEAVRIPPYLAPRVQAGLAVALCDDVHPPDVALLESPRAPLMRFARSTPRPPDIYRGCDAIRAHANAGWLRGSPR